MRMNTSIPMMGQQADIVGSAARGFEAGRKNRLADIYSQHGAGIASGDQNALNALAQFDPTAAMQAQRGHQVMQHADAQEGRLNRQEQRMIEAEAAKLSAADRAAQLAQIEQGVAMGMATNTPQEWDALMSQYAPELVGQFENRQMHANRFLSVAEVLKGMEPAGPQSPAGKLADDLRNGLITQEQYDAATTKTPLVNVNTGDEAPPLDAALRKKLMEKTGESWSKLSDAGVNAARQRPDLMALRELAAIAPSGPLSGRLAEMFPESSDAAAARQAIIKRVAPTLRVEGSGSTSDVEYAGMIEGMGRLINSPEANMAIADMMIAKSELDIERALIVDQYASNEITQTEARQKLSELDSRSIMPESLKRLLKDGGSENSSDGPAKISSDADYEALPSGAEFIAPDGSRRRKP